ncbi:MAG: CHAD domain-containing protein [Candidatus Accumulibacter sp.]|uniref:CYTH and CHAD domain-containing protein n=1 Tax=Accumulibacter sp. TaxID=2053492 RepID=UPI001ACF6B24|nr:CYTH and CHAD domain-containing protein [Accumulibacter sp.]MBN8439299.1 CHAD domain-containing protein [Accumulibacter sp.]
MATETEIKLSLPAHAASQVAKQALLAGVEPQRQLLINTYYDTPDLRLRRERIVVRYRQKGSQWLLTVKTAPQLTAGLAQRSEWEVPARPGAFDFSHVDSDSLRDLLESLRDELQPLFTTHFRRHIWLLEPRHGVRIELALDRGWIDARGQRQTIREVELELLSGEPGDLFALAGQLQASLPLHPEVSSKSERAYRLLADAPLAAVKAPPIATEAGMSCIGAFRMIALSCLYHLQGNEKSVGRSDLPEFVHQARVAIRRLRSAIRLWEPLLPEHFVARFDPLWQGLARQLGDTRNWDVFLAETLPVLAEACSGRGEVERMSSYARRRSASSRRATGKALGTADYSRLLIDFSAALLALPEAGGGPLGTFVPRCLKKSAKQVKKRAVDALGAGVAARHRLRVAFKQLRYALEFFTPILEGPVLSNYHHSASCLQDLLGRLNDLAVAEQLIAEALPGRKGKRLAGWLAAQTESLLPEFSRALNDFQQQREPWQVA